MIPPVPVTVVLDANVLINLIHVSRLDFCANLPDLQFRVPDQVRKEILRPEQRRQLDGALEAGVLQPVAITELEDVSRFADLAGPSGRLGRGEVACLVLATRYGWTIASDERRRFRREAVGRLGKDRLIGTVDLFIRALEAGLITVEEADADKEMLERKKFRMPFETFRERWPALTGKARSLSHLPNK